MKIVNIETDRRGEHEEKVFSALGADYRCVNCGGDTGIIAREAGDADVILFTASKVNKELIDSLPKARLFVRYGVGYDNVDLEYTKSRGVKVCNSPSYGSYDIAEHAFALLMAVNRKIAAYDRGIRAGTFGKSADYKCYRLEGKTLGLIGFGRIARRMLKFSSGFGMNVLVYDPYVGEDVISLQEARKVGFEEILIDSDYISIHAPLNSETAGMFGAPEFEKMKDTAVIINTARGGLIKTGDLIEALRSRTIRGAGIDVYDDYPRSADHPLASLDNIVLTPHAAWNSVEAAYALHEEVADEVARFIRGEELRNVVNK